LVIAGGKLFREARDGVPLLTTHLYRKLGAGYSAWFGQKLSKSLQLKLGFVIINKLGVVWNSVIRFGVGTKVWLVK